MIAPITATPIDPPTWRKALRMADRTSALSAGMAFIAAAVAGVIVSAIPKAAEEQGRKQV